MFCVKTGLGKIAKLFGARAGVRLSCAFRIGKIRQESRGRQSREGGLEVTIREQQGRRVKHENGESEMEINDMRMQQTFLRTLEPCLYVHTHENVQM